MWIHTCCASAEPTHIIHCRAMSASYYYFYHGQNFEGVKSYNFILLLNNTSCYISSLLLSLPFFNDSIKAAFA